MSATTTPSGAEVAKASLPKTDRARLLNCLGLPDNQRRPITMAYMSEVLWDLETGKIDHALSPTRQ